MIERFYPPSLYNFLRYASSSRLEKKILDCGAGGPDPKLAFFHENGFETHGIDISDDQIKASQNFCEREGIELNIIEGDMRAIPFDSECFSFVFSYNSIFHLNKKDTGIAINEICRVLKRGGLCYLNFLSKEDRGFGDGEEVNPGEVVSKYGDEEYLHSFYEDDEADKYFNNFEILYKEKVKILKGRYNNTSRTCVFEYIAKK